jgi:putative spermidine/putrescine transport system substrate-binding protein
MSLPFQRFARLGVLAAVFAAGGAMAQTAICYNCPTEWADWGTQIKAIKAKTGVTVPPDNKNSGQSLAQMAAEKASPVADVTYLGVTFAVQAAKDGLVEPYKPARGKTFPTA